MQDKATTPEEIVKHFNTSLWRGRVDDDRSSYCFSDDDLRGALRALLLHVGEEIDEMTKYGIHDRDTREMELVKAGRNGGIADCKRVIGKMIEEI